MFNKGKEFDEEEDGLDTTECEEMIIRQSKQKKEEEEEQEKKKKEQEKKKQEVVPQDQETREMTTEQTTDEKIQKIDLPTKVLLAINSTGLDRKEHEIKVKTAVNRTPCLILDYSTGRYCRVSMNETNDPPEDTTDIYKRFCWCCNTEIALINWPEHIKTKSHLVRLYLLKHKICFCYTPLQGIRGVNEPDEYGSYFRQVLLSFISQTRSLKSGIYPLFSYISCASEHHFS